MDSDHPSGNGDRPVVASDLVAACEDAWRAIQARHPEVPDTVVVLGSGVERGRLVKLGHWWGGQWRVGGQARGEVLLAGEALHLSPESVFEVLLHEAAHGLNTARGLRDASRGGRYHNQHFKAAAAEVGLRPRRLDPYGWARTELTPATAQAYGEVVGRIGTEMRLARGLPARRPGGVEVGTGGADGDGGDGEAGGDGDGRRPPQRAAECGCEPARRLRMAPSVLALGPVTCGLCGAGFAVPGAEVRRETEAAAGVVDERFVARRVEALAAEAAEARVVEGMAHLDRMGRAVEEVAPERVEGALLVEAFDAARDEIAEWFGRVARRTPAEAVAEAELDLRTVDLPGLGAGDAVQERSVGRGVEPPLPEPGP